MDPADLRRRVPRHGAVAAPQPRADPRPSPIVPSAYVPHGRGSRCLDNVVAALAWFALTALVALVLLGSIASTFAL